MTVLLSFIAIIILLAFVRHRYYWRARKNNVFNDSGTVMIAHRGSKVRAPENTAAAFLEAIDYGFTYLEMDICQLKDETVVCSHNFDLERETNGHGWLYEKNYKDLDLIRAGVYSHPENMQPIPRLTDVLDQIPGHIFLNIEIKCKSVFDLSTARTIGRMTRAGRIKHRFILSCFNPFVVGYLRLFHPQVYVGYLVEDVRLAMLTHWIHPDFLHPEAGLADEAMFGECVKHGLGVNLWTVNSLPGIQWCIKRGVSGVITDNPALAVL